MIIINNLTISFPGKTLLSEINLNISDKERVALIGKNGSGKTTLLKAIAGIFNDYSGQIVTTGKAVYLDQYRTFDEKTPYEYYMKVADTPEKQRLVRSILKGFGFEEKDWHRELSTFSGGEKTRLQIGRLFLEQADFILLDEPTNFLDILGIRFLKNLLKNFNGGYIIISHDRSFLRDTCDRFLEINNMKIWDFNMKFDKYLIERENLILHQQRSMKNKQKEIERLKKIIERYKKWGREKFIKQAKSKEKMLQKMLKDLESETLFKEEEFDKKISIPVPDSPGHVVLNAKNLQFLNIIKNATFTVYSDDKVAIMGKNGSGKSTILKLIKGSLKGSGEIEIGYNVKIEFLDQFVEELNEENSVFEEIADEMELEPDYVIRAYAGRFGFKGEDVFKNVSNLSGGEKQILALAKVLLRKPNLLVLDEPTNHMDLDTVKALEDALKEFKGSVILVSHDEELIKNVCNKYFVLENGILKEITSLNDYKITEIKERKKKENLEFEERKKIKNKLKNLRIKLEELKKEEGKIEEELSNVETELLNVQSDYIKAEKLINKKEELEIKLLNTMEEIERIEKEIKKFEEVLL